MRVAIFVSFIVAIVVVVAALPLSIPAEAVSTAAVQSAYGR